MSTDWLGLCTMPPASRGRVVLASTVPYEFVHVVLQTTRNPHSKSERLNDAATRISHIARSKLGKNLPCPLWVKSRLHTEMPHVRFRAEN